MATTNTIFDPADAAVSINGVPITVWGAGSMFTGSQSNNNSTASTDAVGNGKVVINHDSTGTMTFNLDPATDAYKDIVDMGQSYKEVAISCKTVDEYIHSEHAVLQKWGDVSIGDGAYPTRSIVFECPDYQLEAVR